jgi:hypothetical protein
MRRPEAIQALRAGRRARLPRQAVRGGDATAGRDRRDRIGRIDWNDQWTSRDNVLRTDGMLDASVLDEFLAIGMGPAFERQFHRPVRGGCQMAADGMRMSGEAADWEQVHEHAHAMKGVAGNLGLLQLAALAGQELMRLADWQNWRANGAGTATRSTRLRRGELALAARGNWHPGARTVSSDRRWFRHAGWRERDPSGCVKQRHWQKARPVASTASRCPWRLYCARSQPLHDACHGLERLLAELQGRVHPDFGDAHQLVVADRLRHPPARGASPRAHAGCGAAGGSRPARPHALATRHQHVDHAHLVELFAGM